MAETKNSVKKTIDALSRGATADVWYDAADHDDMPAQKIIDAAQDAMIEASAMLDLLMNSPMAESFLDLWEEESKKEAEKILG